MTAPDLRALTEAYVAAFDACDLDAVSALMDPGFSLTDPGVRGLTPRDKVVEFIGSIFASADNAVSFTARSILVDGQQTVIEFDLALGSQRFEGVDVIDWSPSGQMLAMRAHLTEQG